MSSFMLLVEGGLAFLLLNSLVWPWIMSKASPSDPLSVMTVNFTLDFYSVKMVIITSVVSLFAVFLRFTGGFLFPPYPLGPSVWPFYSQYSLGPVTWFLNALIVILVPLVVYNRISIRRKVKGGVNHGK